MAASNGKSVEPTKKAMNGKATNGHAMNGTTNGYPKAPMPKQKSRSKAKGFSLFSTASWLLTWYSIVTILLRCPATQNDITDSSPKICKPYFQLRSIVTPHLEPYYDQYAGPYVDAARPYYNIVDKKVITPATALGKKYGAPRVQQAQAYGQAQWQKNVQPQVSKYQGLAKGKYDQTVGPHIKKAIASMTPYYSTARDSALQTYYGHVLPTYTTIQPYAAQGYGMASEFAVGTALPYTKWAWSTGTVFLDRTVWPKLRILYGENVEPQLVRIGERLGRYRDGKKLKAIVDEVDSNSSQTSESTTSIASTSILSTVAPSATPSITSTESSETPVPVTEEEVREKASKIVAEDLKKWQEKFAKAADEGSDELEVRISEVTERLIRNQAESVGNSLIIQLEEIAKSSLNELKATIVSIVKSSKDTEESEEELTTAARKAGAAIKDKAQAIRVWRQNFDHETNSLVSKSAQDTFEILDLIRDSGLQEIGMRWAWTDGITHKDWAKYHQLKTKFDEWRVDVEKVAIEHPGLEKARAASEDVENRAMAIAEDAAKELLRLRETGRWKISAKDSTTDFSTKYMPAAAAVAGQKVMDKIHEASEAVAPSSQGTMESVASMASSSLGDGISSASSVASSLAEAVTGASQGTVESIVSMATESASSLSAKASSSIMGEQPGVGEQAINSVKSGASVVSESASSLSSAASSSLSSASSHMSDMASDASSTYGSYTSSLSESISKSGSVASSSISSDISSASSTASSKVWGGAMAQHVEERKIIFEDVIDDSEDETFSAKIQSMASQAGDKLSDVTKAVSEALLGPTPTPDAMTKIASDKYSSALSAASVALYGTEQGTGESISSVVASRYVDAVAAASAIIYGTPMPITGSIAAQATNAYNSALSVANEQYANAKSAVSAQISGKPKPVHQEMLSSAEKVYSDYVSAANVKYQAAVSAVSTGVYGTATPAYQSIFESMSLMAQSRLSEGLSAASAQYADAKNYVAAVQTGTPEKQKLGMQIQEQYYAGIGMAHARYSEFLEAASSAVMPTPSPFLSKASASIIGTPTNKFQAALNTASMHYSQAMATASSQLDQVMASISSLGSANKDIVPTSSLLGAASSRYSAAMAAASSSYSSIQSEFAKKAEQGSFAVSSAVIGTETPWTESVASAASENWEALITKASSQIYGAPTPYFVTRKLVSEAMEYAAQATDGAVSYAAQATEVAAAQYSAVQSLIGELVHGKEPDFTESVYNRLSVAYYTGAGQAASSASSYASEAYASVSSVVSSVFTPPATLEAILDSAASRVNEAVDAASVQFYGVQKGSYEEAVSSASSAYSSMSSVISEQVYGSSTGYVEAAQSSIADAASSAQIALSAALYGTPTGTYESLTNVAGGTIASATSLVGENLAAASSVAGEKYASVQAAASEALYGPEKGALESAQSRLTAAVESARIKLSEYAVNAGEGASAAVSQASEGVEDFASSVSSVVAAATGTAKDEL